MGLLIPIQYHKRRYPDHIKANIQELAGHLDVSKVNSGMNYSLHTYLVGKGQYRLYDSKTIGGTGKEKELLTNTCRVRGKDRERIVE